MTAGLCGDKVLMKMWFKMFLMAYVFQRPWLFQFFYGHRNAFAHLLVAKDTELVIEGYPRCANSFAVLAFERAQQRPVKLAHHLHAQAQVMLAIKYRIPVLVLIRDPISAAASLITRHPELSATYALQHYMDFYEFVRSHQNDLVVAKFTTITKDYGRVVDVLNAKYGTHFRPYRNSKAEDAAVFAEIDLLNLTNEQGQINQLARPSEAKRPELANAQAVVEGHPLAKRAQTLFRDIEPACV